MTVELKRGYLVKIKINTAHHSYEPAQAGDDITEYLDYGFCGDDVPPIDGEVLVCGDGYTLALLDQSYDDVDEAIVESLGGDDSPLLDADWLTVEVLDWTFGDWDSDGTVQVLFVDDNTYAVRS